MFNKITTVCYSLLLFRCLVVYDGQKKLRAKRLVHFFFKLTIFSEDRFCLYIYYCTSSGASIRDLKFI